MQNLMKIVTSKFTLPYLMQSYTLVCIDNYMHIIIITQKTKLECFIKKSPKASYPI